MKEIPEDLHALYFELMAALQRASSAHYRIHGMNSKTESLYLMESITWGELQEAHLVNQFNEWKRENDK